MVLRSKSALHHVFTYIITQAIIGCQGKDFDCGSNLSQRPHPLSYILALLKSTVNTFLEVHSHFPHELDIIIFIDLLDVKDTCGHIYTLCAEYALVL